MDMEAALIDSLLDGSWHEGGFRADVNLARSHGDMAVSAIYADLPTMAAGFAAVFLYVAAMLGKFDAVESRVKMA